MNTMINILVDQNVVLDIFLNENTVEESIKILDLLPNNQYDLCISSKAVVSIHYLLPYRLKQTKAEIESTGESFDVDIPLVLDECMNTIFHKFNILDVNGDDIVKAYHTNWRDFEDCVENAVACRHKLDIILTSDPNDFKRSTLEVLPPADFLKRLSKKS